MRNEYYTVECNNHHQCGDVIKSRSRSERGYRVTRARARGLRGNARKLIIIYFRAGRIDGACDAIYFIWMRLVDEENRQGGRTTGGNVRASQ